MKLVRLHLSGDLCPMGNYQAYYWLVRAREDGADVEEELKRIGAMMPDVERRLAAEKAQKDHLETP